MKPLSLFFEKIFIGLLLILIWLYRNMLKFFLVRDDCRYEPSCSLYMKEALQTNGLVKGLFLGLRRIGRCHPWKNSSTPLYDPVPYPRKDI